MFASSQKLFFFMKKDGISDIFWNFWPPVSFTMADMGIRVCGLKQKNTVEVIQKHSYTLPPEIL